MTSANKDYMPSKKLCAEPIRSIYCQDGHPTILCDPFSRLDQQRPTAKLT